MSEESSTDLVERVRIVLGEAANRADFDAVLKFYAEDAVWVMADEIDTFEGLDAIRRHWEEWYAAYDEYRIELLDVVGLGNGVVLAVGQHGGRLRGGAALREDLALVYEWSNDLIVRVTAFFDIESGRLAAERLAEDRE